MNFHMLIIIDKQDKEIADDLLLQWHEWPPEQGYTHFDYSRRLSTNGEHTHYFTSREISQEAKDYLEQLPTDETLTAEQAEAVSRTVITIFPEDFGDEDGNRYGPVHAVFAEHNLTHDDWEADQIE